MALSKCNALFALTYCGAFFAALIYQRLKIRRSFVDKGRLTWREIQKKYPDQWVTLDEVIYLNDDNCNVESAVVVCSMSDEEYINKRLYFMKMGKEYSYERTQDTRTFCGGQNDNISISVEY